MNTVVRTVGCVVCGTGTPTGLGAGRLEPTVVKYVVKTVVKATEGVVCETGILACVDVHVLLVVELSLTVDATVFVVSADTLAVAGICEIAMGEEVGGAVTPSGDILVSPAGTGVVWSGRVLSTGKTEDRAVDEALKGVVGIVDTVATLRPLLELGCWVVDGLIGKTLENVGG